jgi:glycosyltransferase involved in cell wall biosynthesis
VDGTEPSHHVARGPRIAYFSEVILPWVDGVSRTLGRLFDYLEGSGRDFRIYAPFAPSEEYAWSYRVRTVKSLPFPFHTEYRLSLPERQGLTRDLDAFKPDVIHVCTPTPAAIWAQSYAKSRGIPVAGSYHTSFDRYLRYYHVGFLTGALWQWMRWFYNRCDVVLPPSQATLVELQERGFKNVRLWSRGIDCQLFSPAKRDVALRSVLGADDDTPLLLMVSRLVKEKDLAELVELDRILRNRGLKYRLALVGKGPFAKELQSKLPEAVFAGYLPIEDLTRWYASADIFVFPSTTETFGNVVQEAMASGLATVVANSGGPAGIVEDGVTGAICRPNDPGDMADKVAELLGDPDLRVRYAENGRRAAEARHWDAINNGLTREYEALLSRGG